MRVKVKGILQASWIDDKLLWRCWAIKFEGKVQTTELCVAIHQLSARRSLLKTINLFYVERVTHLKAV